MQRFFSVALAATVVSLTGSGPVFNVDEAVTVSRGTRAFDGIIEMPDARDVSSETVDVAALLTAAHGAPAMICSLAGEGIRNSGWNSWNDGPASPLPRVTLPRAGHRHRGDDEASAVLSPAAARRVERAPRFARLHRPARRNSP